MSQLLVMPECNAFLFGYLLVSSFLELSNRACMPFFLLAFPSIVLLCFSFSHSYLKNSKQINLAHETLKGLLYHWLTKRKPKSGGSVTHNLSNGSDGVVGKSSFTDPAVRNVPLMRVESSDADMADHSQLNASTYSVFDFLTDSPPSIITEGAHSGPWRKKCVDLDGTEDDRDLPWWCIECVVSGRYPKENTK